MLKELWADDTGAILSTEYILIAGITVFGIVPGLIAIRDTQNRLLTNQAQQMEKLIEIPDVNQPNVDPNKKYPHYQKIVVEKNIYYEQAP